MKQCSTNYQNFMSQDETQNFVHTPTILKQVFHKRGITPNKRFGQNFLIDQNTLVSIPVIADLKEDDVVLEIGTGTGGLTRLLADTSRHVFTVEVDKKLFELSADTLKLYKNTTAFHADILKTKHALNPDITSYILDWLKENNQTQIKVVSNLPYHISTPVIIVLLESDLPIESMVFMLQREITERMMAAPGTREYGILTVITHLFSEVEVVKILPPEVFWPKPDVHSALVKLTIHKENVKDRIRSYPFFTKVIAAIFETRRKTLLNSLAHFELLKLSREDIKGILEEMKLDERIRGEALSLDQLIHFSEALYQYGKNGK
ncbi:MAG: 16S rRNA (adenine(1518)-N(6)/adenine(1519)-N(6))-dimethyltransferase RsmA [Candidatus Brocadiaceae bacterium]|nr:16S rRNA (adenine(1518)-N(6)/adenine(1519)-N(6))-dimethyltransferase RsmA [Candidatus Brocadiaceae bacterium]